MKKIFILLTLAWGVWGLNSALSAAVVFQATSPYHNIRVIDAHGVRTLSFDRSVETRMSLANPLQGHFGYIDFFHMPWLFNSEMEHVLMIGLGGGSIQRAYRHYYPDVAVDTVELDPVVVDVAKRFFHVKEDDKHTIVVSDGRLFLRRTDKKYDAVILDAYSSNRYGSYIPHQLATKEFFELLRDAMTENGVVAYNVMGTLQGWRADLLGAVYKTMRTVFPHVYLFPAPDSLNVVLIATKSAEPVTGPMLLQKADRLIQEGKVTYPLFRQRVHSFRNIVPPAALRSPVLTDGFAPVDGLLRQ
jgi:spermidine synthase